LLTRTTL
jgi:hypothetical protein